MKKPHKKAPPSFTVTVAELARLLGCPFEGTGHVEIRSFSSLEKASEGDLVFLTHPKYRSLLEKTKASAAIIPLEEKYDKIPVLKSENPHISFIKAVNLFCEPCRPQPGIHPSAMVSPSAKIGKDVAIDAFVYIGDDVKVGEKTVIFPFAAIYPRAKIGKETIIHSHVSIREETKIGNHVIIHNGVVIGSDGFGFIQGKDRSHIKIPQKGTVIIEDYVEVGANTTIDRATLGETIIRKGTKIDNLVQVAHNVEIGPDSILASQVGIAGSSKLGKSVILGGQVGVADHVRIEDNVIAAAQSGVRKHIPAGSKVAGSPQLDFNTWRKSTALLPQLYDLVKDIKKLKKRIEELEKKK